MTITASLAHAASEIAIRAAIEYIKANDANDRVDFPFLTERLRAEIKGTMQSALNDAADAINAGMHQIAEATFKASMAQAGIAAAKSAITD